MTSYKIKGFLVDMYKDLCETVEDYDIIYKDTLFKEEELKTEEGNNKWINDIDKNEYLFYITNKKLFEKKNMYYHVERSADICIGFQSSKDLFVNFYFGGELILENIFLEKDKITYLKDPLVLCALPYHSIQIKSEEDFEIQCVYLFVNKEYRQFLAQSKYFFKSSFYAQSFVSYELNEKKKEQLLLNGYIDLSFYCIDENYYYLKKKKKSEEMKKYREELIIKAWHPSRVEEWCM